MRYKRTIHAHVQERIETSRTTCDGCSADMEDDHIGYTMNEVEIEARIGDVYPENDHRDVYEVDVCGKCFLARVLPVLAAAGIVMRKRDIEPYRNEDGRIWEPGAEPPPDGSKPFPIPGHQWRFNAGTPAAPRCSFHRVAFHRYGEQGAEAVFDDGSSETIARMMDLPAWSWTP